MRAYFLPWIFIALVGESGFGTPAQKPAKTARRMLYVVPGALPAQYDWQIQGHGVTDIVWVGLRLNAKGYLVGAGTVLAAMEKHSKGTASRPAMDMHRRAAAANYLLVGPTTVEAGSQILNNPRARAASQQALGRIVQDHAQVAGLQLDFEYLPPEYAPAFVAYIRELRAALPRERALHVAVFPPVGMPKSWSEFHDLPELAAAADGIVVMLYDYHRKGTAPGCVSSIAWLGENARRLSRLPGEKVWLGAPLYGYRFSGTAASAMKRSAFQKSKGRRSEADGCFRVQTAGSEIYYPSDALYDEYDRLVREGKFAGVAYWRAGLEL